MPPGDAHGAEKETGLRTIRFDTPTRFTDASALQARLGTDRVSLAEGASVTFEGDIALGTEIVFAGTCHLKDGAKVDNGCMLTNVELGQHSQVRPYSILADLHAGARNLFGPFCFLRDGCQVGDDCILGAHVEAARSRFASGVKVSHRAFIGDAEIGAQTIIGCGVVFCNWDGSARQATRVGSDVTLGSGTLLVPPLSVGDGAIVGAGSVVTGDVPAGARVIQKRR